MKTSLLPFAALTLLLVAGGCAESMGVNPNALNGGGKASALGGGTSTASASGGTPATSTGVGGTASTTTAKGGSTGTTTTASGGTGGTSTTTASGGTTTTSSPPVDCGTTSGELLLVNAPRSGGGTEIGSSTTVTVPAGATVPLSEILVKFCFAVTGISTVTVSPTAVTLDSGAVNTSVSPYYLDIRTSLKITTEATTDGGACVVFNIGSVTGADTMKLSGTDSAKVDWRFSYSGLDRTKPAQVVATRAGTVAACSAMAFQ